MNPIYNFLGETTSILPRLADPIPLNDMSKKPLRQNLLNDQASHFNHWKQKEKPFGPLTEMDRLLKSLFDIDTYLIAMVNDDDLTLRIEIDKKPQSDSKAKKSKCPTTLSMGDRLIHQALFSSRPTDFNIAMMASRNSLPDYLTSYHNTGFADVLMFSLEGKDRIIGVWMVLLKNRPDLPQTKFDQLKLVAKQITAIMEN